MRLYMWLVWINFFYYVLAVPAWIYASMTIWSKFESKDCFSNWVDIAQFVNMMLMYMIYFVCSFTPLIAICCGPCFYLCYVKIRAEMESNQANQGLDDRIA